VRTRVILAAVMAALTCVAFTSNAVAARHHHAPAYKRAFKPRLASPTWLTTDLRTQLVAMGKGGNGGGGSQSDPTDMVFKSCPGSGPTVPGVQAGTCLVDPFGCTANFVYYNGPVTTDATGALRPAGAGVGGTGLPPFTSDGQHWFLGTAGHCLNGGPVLAQVRAPGIFLDGSDAGGIAAIGTAAKKMNAGIGKDFGAIQIYSGFTVTPATPLGAPKGIYTACTPAPIDYWGHGYHFAVAQAKVGEGGGFFPSLNWYTWAGTVFGGDSGSGVTVGMQAAGDLTHGLGIAVVPLPVGYGTRMTKILSFLGTGYYLVNADGTLSRETTTCAGVDAPWDPIVGIKP
jgi:hypothetical protein